MTINQTYRDNAAAQRKLAEESSLQTRRTLHERSAVAWEAMAEAVEDTMAKAAVNAEAKASR